MKADQARTIRSLALIGILCAVTIGVVLLALTGYFSNAGAHGSSDACLFGALFAAAVICANMIVLARVPRPSSIGRAAAELSVPRARIVRR